MNSLNPPSKAEALSWLSQAPDAHGECDRCHKDAKLWALPQELDTEPDAHWLYCSTCFRAIVNRK